MDTWVEKDLCLFWEWAQEYLGRSRQVGPFSTYEDLGQNLIGEHTFFRAVFFKKYSICVMMVCHIGVWLSTKVVKSALRMLALYMYFNGTCIWGGETTYTHFARLDRPISLDCILRTTHAHHTTHILCMPTLTYLDLLMRSTGQI